MTRHLPFAFLAVIAGCTTDALDSQPEATEDAATDTAVSFDATVDGGPDGDADLADAAGDADDGARGDDGREDASADADAQPLDPSKTCENLGADRCAQCCADLHPHGAGVFRAGLAACACDPSLCAAACAASLCADAGLDPAAGSCQDCVRATFQDDAGPACLDPVYLSCRGDQDCALLLNCRLVAGCAPN